MDKEKIRCIFLSKKRSREERERKSKAIVLSMEYFLQKSAPGSWGFFCSLADEPFLDFLWPKLHSATETCFPRIESKNPPHMEFYQVKGDLNKKEGFELRTWGIWEPHLKTAKRIEKNKMKGIFIPLLAFDSHGVRLGRGSGFYDRYLGDFSGKKIGLAFEDQKYKEKLPFESLDVKLDMVITELQAYFFST